MRLCFSSDFQTGCISRRAIMKRSHFVLNVKYYVNCARAQLIVTVYYSDVRE